MTYEQIRNTLGLPESTFYDFTRRAILPSLPEDYETISDEDIQPYLVESKIALVDYREIVRKGRKRWHNKPKDWSLPPHLARYERGV